MKTPKQREMREKTRQILKKGPSTSCSPCTQEFHASRGPSAKASEGWAPPWSVLHSPATPPFILLQNFIENVLQVFQGILRGLEADESGEGGTVRGKRPEVSARRGWGVSSQGCTTAVVGGGVQEADEGTALLSWAKAQVIYRSEPSTSQPGSGSPSETGCPPHAGLQGPEGLLPSPVTWTDHTQ